ncbi:sulfatase-like hydrolase/transferase [Enterococcus asini]|uniref:sulfatase-like hydrolase/transferase n=1 Tax=Enterococcus asini TaxID=57732 RepID=UPI00288DF1AC|nr:sulfatase-like hydrolase/transferase [Enterococcus asini]MDT2756596.1 sulfatase-like hydrolase/transferase [Enterococcus asini]
MLISAVFDLSSSIFLAKLLLGDFKLDYLIFMNFEPTREYLLAIASCIVAGILTFAVLYYSIVILKQYEEVRNQSQRKSIWATFLYGICFLLVFVGFLAFTSSRWVVANFGGTGIQEILYTISQPLAGTDSTQIFSFIFGPLNSSILFSVLTIYFILYVTSQMRMRKAQKGRYQRRAQRRSGFGVPILISLIVLIGGCTLGVGSFGYAEVKAYFFDKSTIYEEQYQNPETTAISFPEQKRNLIYIYVESLETSYLSKDLGGALDVNLLPNLSGLITEGGAVNFSNTEKIGGALPTPGTGFTVGGMVAETAGIPLNVVGGLNANDYGNTSNFLPGAYSLGEILDKENYRQMLMIGSEAAFGGRDKYFTQHGNYEIRDYNYAVENGWIPSDYKVWWGYEDQKLFEFAKESITELSSGDQPFNFTMLTADTHFPDGYATAETENLYDNQYKNVIHASDQMLGAFLTWIQQQPFYENTTIILSGDHLTMDTGFSSSISEDYERTVFNLILNAPVATENTKNRQFSTMDLFPTTLAALNATVEGDRLGLGTNLFSDKETLIEELGYDYVETQLTQRSDFYEENILQGTDMAVKKSATSK